MLSILNPELISKLIGEESGWFGVSAGAWSTTKIPLILFEASSMGWKFTALRFSINIFGIIGIAYITERVLNNNDREELYSGTVQKQVM